MTHKKIITELAVCEKKLDVVLFDMGDASIGAGALGGAGLGFYAQGRRGLKRPKTWDPEDIASTIGRGINRTGKDITGGLSSAKGSVSDLWASLLKKSKNLLPR